MTMGSPFATYRFLNRYKRFLVDMEGTDGETLTAHCPNTGSLRGVLERCVNVRVRDFGPESGRKLRWGVEEMMLEDGTRVLVNTGRSNGLVAEAIGRGLVPQIAADWPLKLEAKYDAGTRFDLCATAPDGALVWGEIKLTTYAEGGVGMFPDAVTERGAKHLRVMREIVQAGGRAVQIYIVGRGDAGRFAPARHIDPTYGTMLDDAVAMGVEVCVLRWDAATDTLKDLLPWAL